MKLERHEEVALELVRGLLWGSEVTIPEDFKDTDSLMAFAKNQSILAVMAKSILSDTEFQSHMPSAQRLKLKSVLVSNVMTFNSMTEVLKKTVLALNEAGVPSILLKGHSMAVNYPYPELRQCGDIDLYVGTENALKTHEVLSGFSKKIDPQSDAMWGKHFSAFVDDIEIEVHRHTSTHATRKFARIFSQAAEKGLSQNLSQVTYDGVQIDTPSVDFNAYYIFDHLFEHFLTSGIGLRHMIDWMLFLHANKENIDHQALKDLITSMDALEPWQVFGCILVNHLGLPQQEFPLCPEADKAEVMAGKADAAFQFILSDGNFGKSTAYYTRRSKNYFLTKLNAIWCHITRGAKMMKLFPRQELRHFQYIIENYFIHLCGDIKRKLNNGR